MQSMYYIGLDVHKKTISYCIKDASGQVQREGQIAATLHELDCWMKTLPRPWTVAMEATIFTGWIYDHLLPHALLKEGNKSDRIDAQKLAELLRGNQLKPVYHGEHGVRTLKELVRSYLTIGKDLAWVMTRLKAIYRSWAIPCTGKQVYAPRYRAEWLSKIPEAGVRLRATFYYQQLDALRSLRHEVRRELLAESKKHKVWKLLCQIPSIGPIRAAVLMGILQTPHRFRTKRQLWTFSGLGIETRSSADHRYVDGQLQRDKKPVSIRGLNQNHNHDLKNLFKGAAIIASSKPGPFQEFYAALLAKGLRPEMARLTLARKIAAITLHVWKKGASFDVQYLKPQTA